MSGGGDRRCTTAGFTRRRAICVWPFGSRGDGWSASAALCKASHASTTSAQWLHRGDGIGPEAVVGVEADVAALFSQLEITFSKRPFLLGDRPTSDIGFSGPFFRHLLWTRYRFNYFGTRTQYAGVGYAFVEQRTREPARRAYPGYS